MKHSVKIISLTSLGEPFGGLYFLAGLTNLAMLSSPIFFFLREPSRWRLVAYVLAASSLLNVLPYFLEERWETFSVGYYLWYSSFVLVTFAFYRRTRSTDMASP